MKLIICIFLFFLCIFKGFAQLKIKDSCTAFTLQIEGKNLISDSLILSYKDCDKKPIDDTLILSEGKIKLTGKINRATEAIVFTDLRSKWMDGPHVIRFIMEPGIMTLHFAIRNDTVINILIRGSHSQDQKLAWEKDNATIISAKYKSENESMRLFNYEKTKDSIKVKKREIIVRNQIDSLRQFLVNSAIKYVKENPESYFSGYLLYHYKRHIATDTLVKYFSSLKPNVIFSDFGKYILEELYKLTDDWTFKKNFSDSDFYKSLESIDNIYDISLPDLDGTKTSFSKFKGKFLLIDFWASWCGPCIRNAPYLDTLSKEMKGKPFKIVSVSIDDNINKWKKAIKKYKFPGIHLFDEEGLLSTYYKVLWVPTYIIIDPNGILVNADAPQPMDPQLKILIDKLLQEKEQKNPLEKKTL